MCATTPVVHHSGAHCVPQEMLSKFETTRVHGVQLVEMAAAIDGPGRSPTLLVDPGHEGRYLGISAAQDGPLSLVATSFVVYVPAPLLDPTRCHGCHANSYMQLCFLRAADPNTLATPPFQEVLFALPLVPKARLTLLLGAAGDSICHRVRPLLRFGCNPTQRRGRHEWLCWWRWCRTSASIMCSHHYARGRS